MLRRELAAHVVGRRQIHRPVAEARKIAAAARIADAHLAGEAVDDIGVVRRGIDLHRHTAGDEERGAEQEHAAEDRADDNTGAGGANVHTDEDLLALWPNSPLRPLPTGTSLTVAFGRALRIGDKAGQPLEDLGVTPTEQHRIISAALDLSINVSQYPRKLPGER